MHDGVSRVLFRLLKQTHGDLVYDGLFPYEDSLFKLDRFTESYRLADKREAQHIESQGKQAKWTAVLWKSRKVAIFVMLLLKFH